MKELILIKLLLIDVIRIFMYLQQATRYEGGVEADIEEAPSDHLLVENYAYITRQLHTCME